MKNYHKFTIFGGSGFIGKNLVNYLRSLGYEVFAPSRNEKLPIKINLGHVIFAIGITGNFRGRPFDTIESNVSILAKYMQSSTYNSWLFLSSARIYGVHKDFASETDYLEVFPSQDSIYDISKLLAESLCMSINNPKIRIARISNVYGASQSRNTFLGSLLSDISLKKKLLIKESKDSSKDYISISDLTEILVKISIDGKNRIYNVASGKPITHLDLSKSLKKYTKEPIFFEDNGVLRVFPQINISRIEKEFNFKAKSLLDDLPDLIKHS